MRVKLNPDTKHVRKMRHALSENDNYCPCSRVISEDTKCLCKDFRDKLSDPHFLGECNCGLYIKTEV